MHEWVQVPVGRVRECKQPGAYVHVHLPVCLCPPARPPVRECMCNVR